MKRLRGLCAMAMMGVVLVVSKEALAALPNFEAVSLLTVLFTLSFGKWVLGALGVFLLLEGLLYGFHLWWVTYLYIWSLWALAVLLIGGRKERGTMVWAVASGAFGLSFGALDALPYLAGGPMAALSRWVSGIPFDVLHCIGNFFLALALERPLCQLLRQARERTRG